jgi:hypothetical protein
VQVQEARAHGFSLWLMQEEPVRKRFSALVESLAVRLGTTPFPPHITLLPGLDREPAEILAGTRSVASTLRPFRVRLLAVEGREEHFRCLIALAAREDPLRDAHVAAARAFDREPDPEFLPHVSLVYGWLPAGTRRALAAEVAPAALVSFRAASLEVWRTEGPVAEWRQIGAFELGGRSDFS